MHQSCRGTAAIVLTHLAAGCSNLADFPLEKKRDYIKVWLPQRCRCGNTVKWMEGTSCRGHTPSFRHAWRSKGGQVVTLVCRTRSPLLFTPQVYTLQPSWLVVFTCRERHTHIHTVFMCIPVALCSLNKITGFMSKASLFMTPTSRLISCPSGLCMKQAVATHRPQQASSSFCGVYP